MSWHCRQAQTEPLLRTSATTAEILEAMKHPITGIGFLTMQQNLPSQTFVSADAVTWLINHMEGVIAIERGIQVRFVQMRSQQWSKRSVLRYTHFVCKHLGLQIKEIGNDFVIIVTIEPFITVYYDIFCF